MGELLAAGVTPAVASCCRLLALSVSTPPALLTTQFDLSRTHRLASRARLALRFDLCPSPHECVCPGHTALLLARLALTPELRAPLLGAGAVGVLHHMVRGVGCSDAAAR